MARLDPDRHDAAAMAAVRPVAFVLVLVLTAACSGAAAGNPPAASTQPSMAAIVSDPPTAPPTPLPSLPPTPEPDPAPSRTVEESGGFRMTAHSSASCIADAPIDWAMTAPDRSDRADMISSDGSMYAGYGIQTINTTLGQFASTYNPPLNDPDLYSGDPATVAIAYARIVAGGIGAAPDVVGDQLYQATPEYLVATLSGSTHQGAVFFHATGFPGDGINYAYALPMYFAFATTERWATEGLLVARVAASIRCSTQFQPPDDYPVVEAGEAGTAGDENGDEYGYNPQLGTEYANDPQTGENYLVDPAQNWSETGPDGPGYYVQKGGGDYQKLDPGRID